MWGGVGWGGIITSLHLPSHALPHIRYATLLCFLMHFHTYVMLRCCVFSCTSTDTSCYAVVFSHALPHIRHATLLSQVFDKAPWRLCRPKKDWLASLPQHDECQNACEFSGKISHLHADWRFPMKINTVDDKIKHVIVQTASEPSRNDNFHSEVRW